MRLDLLRRTASVPENRRTGCARRRAVLLLGALVYAVLYAFCSQIDEVGFIQWRAAVARFALALPVALAALWLLMRHVLPKTEMKPDADEKKPFRAWGAFLFIFCCYVPMFLIEYPGSFTYDCPNQVLEIVHNEYRTHHPLLHTLLIRFAISFFNLFQSMEKCGALYSVIQMTLVSLCFAQVCASLSRSMSRRAARLTMLFFGLYPSHMAFASNCTKDVLFSAFLALFLALCFEEIACGLTCGRRVLQVVSGVLACLLRNNMIYAMIAWVVLLLLIRRRYLRMALCGVLAILLALGINAGLKEATHAQSGSIVEMFSVPIQQLARVRLYAPQMLNQEELEAVDAVFQGWRFYQYEPTISDPIKNNLVEPIFRENLPGFLKAWVTVGIKCPSIYLDAFLSLALPSMYPYREYKVPVEYIELGGDIALTASFGLEPMTRPRRFDAIREWLAEHIFSTGADDIPVVRWLFNTGFIFWLLLLLVLYDMYCGRWDRVLLCILPVLLWGTYLLGPVMQGRYLYPFICVLPLFLFRRRAADAKAY